MIATYEDLSAAYRYDAESGTLYRRDPRYIRMYGHVAAGMASDGYRRITFRGRQYQAHRVCWLLQYGEWPAALIDHVNGDKADNRIANLRAASFAQNGWNTGPRNGLLKGVTFIKSLGKYQAQIKANGKSYYLGLHGSEAEAHEAYKAAAETLHGVFRRFAA